MKLAVFGSALSSPEDGIQWRSLCRALTRRRHSVTFFEHADPGRSGNCRGIEIPDVRFVPYVDWNEAAPRVEQQLSGVDVAIVASDCPDAVVASAASLSSSARLKVFYDLNAPDTLRMMSSGQEIPYIGSRGLAAFDLVLSSMGGVALTELQNALGARRVTPFYSHVDPEVYRPVAAIDQYRSDFSYLKDEAGDTTDSLDRLFFKPAKRLPKHRFLLGNVQPQNPAPDNPISYVPHVPAADHAAFFCSSRITLNVTRSAMLTRGFCPTAQIFEAAACGTPIVSDHWPGLHSFFSPGKEILLAQGPDDIGRVLALSDHELSQIAAAARERTLAENSSFQRVLYLERVLSDTIAGSLTPGLSVRDFSDTESSVPGSTEPMEV